MAQVDYDELLSSEFETQSTQKCVGVAIRAALRDFPSVNLGGNVDATRDLLFPCARLLMQSVVHWHFDCDETADALGRTLQTVNSNKILLHHNSPHLAALSTHSRSGNLAKKAAENTMVSFASAADREESLYDSSYFTRSTRLAYNKTADLLVINCLRDFETPSDRAFVQPLWSAEVKLVVPVEERNNFEEFFHGHSFEFWREWRRGFIDGQPLDWELQRRVALIEDRIWNAGPEAVADEIERIRARWRVETALADLKGSMSAPANARHGIGGNNPPECIQDERLSGAVTLIWEAKEELSTALEQESPAREWIEAILKKFKAGCVALGKWIGRKADLAVDTAIVTAIKQGGPLVGGYYALDKLIKAIEDWLPFLP